MTHSVGSNVLLHWVTEPHLRVSTHFRAVTHLRTQSEAEIIIHTALTISFKAMVPILGKVAFVTGVSGITGNALVEDLIRQPSTEWLPFLPRWLLHQPLSSPSKQVKDYHRIEKAHIADFLAGCARQICSQPLPEAY